MDIIDEDVKQNYEIEAVNKCWMLHYSLWYGIRKIFEF